MTKGQGIVNPTADLVFLPFHLEFVFTTLHIRVQKKALSHWAFLFSKIQIVSHFICLTVFYFHLLPFG